MEAQHKTWIRFATLLRSPRLVTNAKEMVKRHSVARDIVSHAVARDGSLLQYASPGLRGDRDVVSCAVQQTGSAIAFASLPLRKDVDIAVRAVSQSKHALQGFITSNLTK